MRAAKARIEARKELLEEQFNTALKIQKAIMNFVDKAQYMLQSIHSKLPQELQQKFYLSFYPDLYFVKLYQNLLKS